MVNIAIKPAFPSHPPINSIPDSLLPQFDPVYADYYTKHNAGRYATHQVPIEAFRADPSKYSVPYAKAIAPDVHRISDQQCPVAGGSITIRIFEPAPRADGRARPAYINFHGGGWVFGNLTVDNEFCKRVVGELGCVAFDVDYRLAPEHPFPIPVEDSIAAFKWIQGTKLQEFNLDVDRFAVGGVSAGGHLSAVLAHVCRDEGLPLAFQLLSVPVVDMEVFTPMGELKEDCPYESYREMHDTVPLPVERMSYFAKHFLGCPRPETLYNNWKVSPMWASNFKNLAPALVLTAEMDPLRDEGAAYAAKLKSAGCKVEYICAKGAPHIFMMMDEILDIGKMYNRETIKALGDAFRR